jgi:hypothetical protein
MVNVEECFHHFFKWYNKIVLRMIWFADRGLRNSDLKKQLLAIKEADDDVTRVGNLFVLHLNQITRQLNAFLHSVLTMSM